MAIDTATHSPGLCADRLRRMDHLEADLRSESKRVPGSHRIRDNVPRSKIRRRYYSFLAWVTVIGTSGTAGVLIAAVTSRGR